MDVSKAYTVKSTYESLLSHQQVLLSNLVLEHIFGNSWCCKAPSKVLAFSWQLVLDRLPTRNNILRRLVILDASQITCVLCGSHDETANCNTPFFRLPALK